MRLRFKKSDNTNGFDIIQAAVSAALFSLPSLPTTLEMPIGGAFGLFHENEDRVTIRALVDKPTFERYL